MSAQWRLRFQQGAASRSVAGLVPRCEPLESVAAAHDARAWKGLVLQPQQSLIILHEEGAEASSSCRDL